MSMLPMLRKTFACSCRSTLPRLISPQSPRNYSSEISQGQPVTPAQPSSQSKTVPEPKKPGLSFVDLLGEAPKRSFNKPSRSPLNFCPLPDTRKPSAGSGPFVAYRGRSKPVINGDIAGAFRNLNFTLKVNNVARDYKTQRFHEKPSDKRGRLARERHRRRFLSGVKRLVSLVKQQRKYA